MRGADRFGQRRLLSDGRERQEASAPPLPSYALLSGNMRGPTARSTPQGYKESLSTSLLVRIPRPVSGKHELMVVPRIRRRSKYDEDRDEDRSRAFSSASGGTLLAAYDLLLLDEVVIDSHADCFAQRSDALQRIRLQLGVRRRIAHLGPGDDQPTPRASRSLRHTRRVQTSQNSMSEPACFSWRWLAALGLLRKRVQEPAVSRTCR